MAEVENPHQIKNYFSARNNIFTTCDTNLNLNTLPHHQATAIYHSNGSGQINSSNSNQLLNMSPHPTSYYTFQPNNSHLQSVISYHDSSCLSSPTGYTAVPSPPTLSSSLSSSQSTVKSNNNINNTQQQQQQQYNSCKKRPINSVDNIDDNDNLIPNKKYFIDQTTKPCNNNNNNTTDIKQCKLNYNILNNNTTNTNNNSFSQDEQQNNTIILSSNPSSPYVFSKMKMSNEDSTCTTDSNTFYDRQSPLTITSNSRQTSSQTSKKYNNQQIHQQPPSSSSSSSQNFQPINFTNDNINIVSQQQIQQQQQISMGIITGHLNLVQQQQQQKQHTNNTIKQQHISNVSPKKITSTHHVTNSLHISKPTTMNPSNPYIIITDKNNNFKPITKEFLPNSYSTTFPSIHFNSLQHPTFSPTRIHYSLSPFLQIEKEQPCQHIAHTQPSSQVTTATTPSPKHHIHTIQTINSNQQQLKNNSSPISPEINIKNNNNNIKTNSTNVNITLQNNNTNNNNNQTNNNNTSKKKKTSQGYCECCNTDFESLKFHLESKEHRTFSEKDKNYSKIDAILPKLLFNSNTIW